jgi:hypothetical protein
MSRQELVSAFLDGQISRRTLVRRLIAGGVSAGAAISYAQLLAPEHATAATRRRGSLSDQYPLVDMGITSPSLASVRNNARIAFKVFCTEELSNASFTVFQKTAAGGVRIGSKHFVSVMSAAGSRSIAVNVATGLLAGKSSVRFYIQMVGQDSEGFSALASTAKTLS